ncbi:MAG: ATP-binding cassette domain-containing protein, partial [Sporichthyaceae bacterium]
MNDRAGLLSGGQQQMLALAQALVQGPPGENGRSGVRLLLIDELSLGLAPAIVSQLLEVVLQLRDEGLGILLVEQSAELALKVADRAMFMEKGECRFSGPAADILERGDLIRSVFLAGALEEDAPEPTQTLQVADRPAIGCTGLRKSFGGVAAIDGVDLDVYPGEIVGLMGPNGAGKTTILDALSGFLVPDAGRVRLAGRDVTALAPQERAHLGLGRSFQDAKLFPAMTVEECLKVSLERFVEQRDPVTAALHLPMAFDSEANVQKRVNELVEL